MQKFKYVWMVVSAVAALGAGCSQSTTDTSTTPVTEEAVVDTTTDTVTDTVVEVEEADVDKVGDVDVVDEEEVVVEEGVEAEVIEEDVDEVEEVVVEEEVAEEAIAEPVTQTFDVVAKQFTFEPATITVNKGDTVVLNVTSEDVPHGFSISEFGVNQTLSPGVTETIEFVADQAGTFSYVCSVVCGTGHSGMKGTLVVQE